jgi:hypothetical protein
MPECKDIKNPGERQVFLSRAGIFFTLTPHFPIRIMNYPRRINNYPRREPTLTSKDNELSNKEIKFSLLDNSKCTKAGQVVLHALERGQREKCIANLFTVKPIKIIFSFKS